MIWYRCQSQSKSVSTSSNWKSPKGNSSKFESSGSKGATEPLPKLELWSNLILKAKTSWSRGTHLWKIEQKSKKLKKNKCKIKGSLQMNFVGSNGGWARKKKRKSHQRKQKKKKDDQGTMKHLIRQVMEVEMVARANCWQERGEQFFSIRRRKKTQAGKRMIRRARPPLFINLFNGPNLRMKRSPSLDEGN